jgi:hypothetical protein
MANQKISDLEKVGQPTDLAAEDLFVVVDSSSSSSPSGETKGITASTLAQALTQLSQGLLGADFTNLRDTPSEYTYDNHGNFIKVNVTTAETGELQGSLEFVDSPGASEQTFPFIGNFESDDPTTTDIDEGHFFVGALVRRTTTGKFALADASDASRAECVGIIKKIKTDSTNTTTAITIVFGGYVEFAPQSELGLEVMSTLTGPPTQTTNLDNGVVYFLGKSGRLINVDPSLTDGDGTTHVSKPVLIGAGGTRGIFVNYRGIYQPEDLEANKFIIEREGLCSDHEVGDILRIKASTAGADYIMSSAEDFDTSDVVGIVVSASTEHYIIQTNGMATFDMPDTSDVLHLQPGQQYYLEDMEFNGDRLSLNQWSQLDEEQRGAIREKEPIDSEGGISPKTGTPFRNSRPSDPGTPLELKDDISGNYETFSRPVFYAITSNRLLLTNHRTLPNPYLECYDCLKSAETQKSIYWPNFPVSQDIITQTDLASQFLLKVWPTAGVGHRAILYYNDSLGETLTMIKRPPQGSESNVWEQL